MEKEIWIDIKDYEGLYHITIILLNFFPDIVT